MAGKKEIDIGIKFTGDASGFQRVASNMNSYLKGIKDNLSTLSKTVGLNQALELGKKGWEAYKTIMNSTEGSAEKLEQQIATLDGAMQGLVKTVATGSWEKLFSNITTTAEATRELTKATQEYNHAKSGTSIKLGERNIAFQEARVNAAEATSPAEKAKYLKEAVDLRREITTIEVGEIAKRLGITEDYYQKLTGYDKRYFDSFLKLVPDIAKEYDYYLGPNSVVLEGAKARIESLKYLQQVGTKDQIPAYKEEMSTLQDLVKVLEDFRLIQDDFSKKDQWDQYIKGIGEMKMASAEGEKALLRLVKQLTTAQGKLDEVNKINRFEGITKAITKMPGSFVDAYFKGTPVKGGGMARGGKDLAGAPIISSEINDEAGKIKVINDLTDTLSDSFEALFTSISAGSNTAFADMAKAFTRSLEVMAAQMAAKAAIFAILTVLTGGTGAIATMASTILGGRKLGTFMGFAEGTDFAPGGMALVGERGPEIVNLPRGSQVIPNGRMGQRIQIYGRLIGSDIYLSNQRYSISMNQNT